MEESRRIRSAFTGLIREDTNEKEVARHLESDVVTMTTRKQKEAAKKGLLAEKRVARWLIDRGWTHIHYHRRHHAGPFDIDCKKKGESWLIEVKTGEKPSVKIANLVRMLEAKRNDRVDKAALTFVPSNVRKPLLMFAMDKPKYVALKASIKRAGSEAARKAWRTRRRSQT